MTDPADPPPPPSRRDLIRGAAAAAGIATVAGLWFEGFGDPSRRRRLEPTRAGAPLRALEPAEARTLGAACNRLLPSQGPASPGARDVNALGYFDALFADDVLNAPAKKRILWGVRQLDRRGESTFSIDEFSKLRIDQQDRVLKTMENSGAGVRWLRLVIEFVLECFFGDPVHGGNTNQIGWKWIRLRPGTPRPTQPGWKIEEQA